MKRVVCLLLVLTLLMGAFPVSAYGEETSQLTAQNSEITAQGTNDLGVMLSEELEQAQQKNSTGANIQSLEIADGVATVRYSTLEQAYLVVALYSEDAQQLLFSANLTVQPEETAATISLDGEIPEYFMATAYLLDTYDHSPLCAAYETPMYTRQMQALLASTTQDYDPDLVLNLDADETTNFAVCDEKTVVIQKTAGINTVTAADAENAVYTVENADAQFTALQPGDVLVYPYGDNDLMIVKVAQITVDGTTVTVTGGDVELEEVFSHLKIETTGSSADAQVDETGVSAGAAYLGKNALKPASRAGNTASETLDFELDLAEGENLSIQGVLSLQIDVSYDYYISSSYQQMLFLMDNQLEVSAEVTAESPWTPQWELTGLNIPLLAGAVVVGVRPGVELSLTMEGTFSATVTASTGFNFTRDHTGWSCTDLSVGPQVELQQELQGELGISLYVEPHIGLVGGVLADVSLKLSVGGRITAQLDFSEDAGEQLHQCTSCVDGDIEVFLEGSVELQLLKMDFLTFTAELLELSYKLTDFYICACHSSGLKWGECPYVLYHTVAQVYGKQGQPVENAAVTADGQTVMTNANGVAELYLPKKEHQLTASFEGVSATQTVTADQAQKVTFRLGVSGSTNNFYNQGVTEVDLITAVGNIIASGSCGTDAAWILYENGLLQIRGSGSVTGIPWADYRSDIQYLKIGDGINSFPSNAFKDCVNLVSMQIPARLFTGNFLVGCSNISSIRFTCPEGSTVAMPNYEGHYDRVTKYCNNSLKTVVIDEGVTHIGNLTFVDCAKLESVSLPSTLKSIGHQAFQNCVSLTAVTLPGGLETIDSNAFLGCTGLVTAALPDSLRTLGAYAFQNCSSLEKAGGPESLESIGKYCFDGCTSLRAFALSEHLTTIPECCFQNCSSIEKIVIPNSVTFIDSNAFKDCTGLTDLTIPAQLRTSYCFSGCGNITSIHFTCPTGSTVEMPYYEGHYDWVVKHCRESLKTARIDEGVTHIGNLTFVDCTKLESVSLPSTLKSIGHQAFQNCPSLTTVTLPEGLAAIDSNAFLGCTGLVTAVLPDSLRTLGDYAFQNCSSLENAGGPCSLESIGKYCFDGCTSLRAFAFSEHLPTIPEYCFQNCSSIEKIVIPNSVTRIDNYAFHICTGLTDLTVPAHVKGGNYFDGCANITSIHYTCPEGSAVSMQDYEYYYSWTVKYCRESLKTVQIDEGVTRIGNMTFVDCPKLETVSLPSTLKSIGHQAFQGCTGLTTIELPEGLETVEGYAFNGCTGLVTAVLPDSLRTLGDYAFQNCSSLENAGGPESLESIGKYCFDGCTSLRAFALSERLTTIPDYCFYNCSSLEKIVIPNTVTVINSYAFSNCTGLTDLTIPAQLRTSYCFSGCGNITSIRFTCPTGSTMEMPYYEGHYDWVVKHCRHSLKTVQIDEGVTHIGNITFAECSKLESVSLPSTLQSIGGQAFQGCTSLSELYFIGDAPGFAGNSFNSVTAVAYYPEGNDTWTTSVMQNYGGSLTWTPYTPEAAAAVTEATEPTVKKTVRAVSGGTEEETVFDTKVLKTSFFSGLVAGEEYAVLVLKKLSLQPLSPENVLYITQQKADESGNLSVRYVAPEDGVTTYAVACGPSAQNLKDAHIQVRPQAGNGKLKTVSMEVIYDGKLLTEGEDYTLTGTVSYTENGTYTCYVRGIRAYTGFVACSYTVEQAEVEQWNLILGDAVGMNFFAALPDDFLEDTVVQITAGGETAVYPAAQAPRDAETGLYSFRTELAAAQMTEPVTVCLLVDGTQIQTKTYSVRRYADHILAEENGFDDKTKALVAQMLSYGGAAQAYFGYNTDDLASTGISVAQQVPAGDGQIGVEGAVDGVKLYGASLLYRNKNAVRFYFTGVLPEGATFTVNGGVYMPVQKEQLYYVEVAGIDPQALDRDVVLTVTDGTAQLHISYSPMDYICRMYHKPGAANPLKALLMALYNYHLAAQVYTGTE
ncbi:MAG: leucine-rich repeat protein [Oscillospiraceae bacterium]|nr:leucine-rich repeat protein [Oscillospiraceae bacterium]